MINRMRITANLSSRFISAPISSKQGIPFFIIYSSTFHTSNPQPLTRSDLHLALDRITYLDEAVALFDYMLQMKPTPSISFYNKLFKSIVKLEQYSHVILMFKKLSLLGCAVNVYIMTTVINCYCHLKQVDLGFAIVADFLKRGYFPNVVTFTCMIKGFFLKGNVAEAVGLFKKVIRDKLCQVNEFTIAIVLDGLSKSGNIVNAVELLQLSEKKDWKLDVVCYNTVLDGLCKGGMLKDAMALLFRMVDRDVIPDVFTYNSFMHALCMNGKLDFARGIFNDLASKGIYPDVITYNVMIQGFCKQRLFRPAKDLLDKMEPAGCFPNCVTYNIIIQACLHNCDNLDSVNLLKKIVGMDFQLHAANFFLLLRVIQAPHQRQGIYDDDVLNHLIQKLISSLAYIKCETAMMNARDRKSVV